MSYPKGLVFVPGLVFAVLFAFGVCSFAEDAVAGRQDNKADVSYLSQDDESYLSESADNSDAGAVDRGTSYADSENVDLPEDSALSESGQGDKSEHKEENSEDDDLISISFATGKEISEVLRALAAEAGINIVMSPEVTGQISGIELNDVKWEDALNVIVSTYGFGYEKEGNIVTVAPLEKITQMKKQKMELSQVQETITKVFNLKYIDAGDAMSVIETFLSPRGTAEVLQMTGQAGWNFVTAGDPQKMQKSEREGDEKKSLSRKLIVTDIKPVIEKVSAVLKDLDVKPKQVMIEANIVEVDWKKLNDLGADISTGNILTGDTYTSLGSKAGENTAILQAFLGNVDGVTPAYYSSPSSIGFNKLVGGGFTFAKLNGNEFFLSLKALEELADANVISAPKIMTLDNQEASILVGTKYPILDTSQESNSSTITTTVSLSYYQDIGVQLNVVPQVNKQDDIKMIIHPAVVEQLYVISGNGMVSSTAGSSSDSDTSMSGGTFPVLQVREAETQLIMKSGETIVIGGLMKDQDKTSVFKIPGLSALPVLGNLFKHQTHYLSKVDLFIFVTASVVDSKEENLKAQELYQDTQNRIRHY